MLITLLKLFKAIIVVDYVRIIAEYLASLNFMSWMTFISRLHIWSMFALMQKTALNVKQTLRNIYGKNATDYYNRTRR